MRLDCLVQVKEKCSITHFLLVMGDMVRLDCLVKEKMQYHLHTIGHEMRHDETENKCSLTHILWVMG